MSFSKTCSTLVVATCASIRVVIFTDLILSTRGIGIGRGIGRGGGGQRWHSSGMMMPCALARLQAKSSTAKRARILVFMGTLLNSIDQNGSSVLFFF